LSINEKTFDNPSFTPKNSVFFAQMDSIESEKNQIPEIKNPDEIIFLGTVLGVFLVVQKDDSLYLIDQHATHERILFNKFIENMKRSQKLLFPYVIETQSDDDDEYLKSVSDQLHSCGFSLHSDGTGRWEFSEIPANYIGTEESLAEDLLGKHIPPQDLLYSLAAKTACRGAVKDGTFLDAASAKDLAVQAFSLTEKTCPHGRPLWVEFSKDNLFRLIRRTE
jgi:DNA mismatch repair protein MutL